jgi:hypothetical protein
MTLSSTYVQPLPFKYKAVMATAGSHSPLILGESNSFDVLPISAALKTDKTHYYEGEWMNVTYTMSEDSVNMGEGFAWIALFAEDVSDYSAVPFSHCFAGYRMVGNSESIAFSRSDLPAVKSKYKAVMALSGSNPLRILGVSNSFDVLPNSAALTSDKTQYYEGELINVTYTMNRDSDNMEAGFAWIGLFAYNVTRYSLYSIPKDAYQFAGYGMAGNSGTIALSSKNLPK